jgi:hypothetical protein
LPNHYSHTGEQSSAGSGEGATQEKFPKLQRSRSTNPNQLIPTNNPATTRRHLGGLGELASLSELLLVDLLGMRAAMRCKLHPYANAGGVCAPCLRDRLLALAAERDQAAATSDDTSCGSSPPARRHQQRDEAAATRGFPSSVSPYVAARRRSDACAVVSSAHQPGLPFFRTPQVGPAAGEAPAEEESHRKVARRRRSFLAAIFGRRRRGREEEEEEGAGAKEKPRRSASWLSAIVRRKRRLDVSLRPAALPDEEEPPESPGGSSTTTSWWFPSPSPARQQQHRRRHGASGGDGMSGFAVCLSPLVRPSSAGGRRRCQPPDPSSFSLGDSHRRHASASFGRNTSRKLADMSRFR